MDELDEGLMDAIHRMDDESFKDLVTKLLGSMGLEITFTEFEDEKGDIEARVGEKIHDADYPAYFIRVIRKMETIQPEELQDFIAARKDRDMGMIFITTAAISENAILYAKEFEIEVVDGVASAALLRKFDLLPDVMIYRDMEILEREKGRFLPSVDELENIIESGNESYAKGDYPEALEYFTKATELKPAYDAAWYMIGVIFNNLKRPEEALGSLMKALENNIENENAWYEMGIALYSLGRYDEELESYDKAIELRKDFLDAWNNKGSTLLLLERYEEANECYGEILRLNPNFKMAWNNKGIALKKMKRSEEAILCFTKAIKVDTHYADAWLNKGLLLLAEKRYKEAYHCFEAVLILEEDNLQALYNEGKILEAIGQNARAIECYDTIIALDPEFKAAKRRKKKAEKTLEQEDDKPLDDNFFRLDKDMMTEYLLLPPKEDAERILIRKTTIHPGEYPPPPTSPPPIMPHFPLPQAPFEPPTSPEMETLMNMKRELEEKERDLERMEAELEDRQEAVEKRSQELISDRTLMERTREELEDEKMALKKMAEKLEERTVGIVRIEEEIKKTEKLLKEEITALEREREALAGKAESMTEEEERSKEEHETLEQKLGEFELKGKDIKAAEEVLAEEKEALERDVKALGKERERLTKATEELTSRESAIYFREEDINRRHDELEKKIKEVELRERELEKIAFEINAKQDELALQAKILEDKEKSLQEDIKIRAEESHIEKVEDKVEAVLPESYEYEEAGGEELLAETAVVEDLEVGHELESVGVGPQPMTTVEEGILEGPRVGEVDLIKEISALYSLKRFDDALERIEKALQQGLDSKLLWNMKGNIMWGKRPLEEALECYGKALSLDSNYVVTLMNLMSLNCELGRYDEAYQWCERLNALKSGDERFLLEKALLEAREGRVDIALTTLDTLLEIDGELEGVWNLKGVVLYSLLQKDEAISCFEKALAIRPDYAIAWNNKAVALYHSEKYEKALQCFNRAIDIMPSEQFENSRKFVLEKLGDIKGVKVAHPKSKEGGTMGEVVRGLTKPPAVDEKGVKETEADNDDSPSLYMCPSCGSFIGRSATTCEKCGYSFEDKEKAGAVEESEEESLEKLIKISGIGRVKAEALYEAGYSDYAALREASISDLMKVEGISKSVAENIKKQLKRKEFKKD